MKISNLFFRYNKDFIFKDSSFDFGVNGNFYHIKGPNGSGKSTLLRILAGIIIPEAGTIIKKSKNLRSFLGFNGLEVGCTSQFNILDFNIGCADLDLGYLNKLVQDFDISNYMKVKVGKLSLGTYNKVSLISTLVTKPEIIILDEPLNGLDLNSQKALINIINEDFLESDKIVIMSSHIEMPLSIKNYNAVLL